jgi:hypothetical protein
LDTLSGVEQAVTSIRSRKNLFSRIGLIIIKSMSVLLDR